jgi:hypothetical protein
MEKILIEHGTHPSLSPNLSEKKPYLWNSMPKRRQKNRKSTAGHGIAGPRAERGPSGHRAMRGCNRTQRAHRAPSCLPPATRLQDRYGKNHAPTWVRINVCPCKRRNYRSKKINRAWNSVSYVKSFREKKPSEKKRGKKNLIGMLNMLNGRTPSRTGLQLRNDK